MSEQQVGFQLRLLDASLALKAIIKPYVHRMYAIVPMSQEPKELTERLDTCPFVGDISFNAEKQTYTWEWLDYSAPGMDELLDEIVKLLIDKHAHLLEIYSTLDDAE